MKTNVQEIVLALGLFKLDPKTHFGELDPRNNGEGTVKLGKQ